MDDITLTLNRLERHLGRAFDARSNEDEITQRIKRIAEDTARQSESPVRVSALASGGDDLSWHDGPRHAHATPRHENAPLFINSLTGELSTLRNEMRTTINSGIREEFAALRDELGATVAALPPSRDTDKLEAVLRNISRSMTELLDRDDRDTRLLQVELERVKAAIADLVHSEQVRSEAGGFGNTAAFQALETRFDQVLASIDHLPETISIHGLEVRLQQLAHSLEHLALHAQSERPELLALIDERLDEISRAIAASAALARTSGIDGAVLHRIEGRIGSLATQINELAEGNAGSGVIEHLSALSRRVDDIAERLEIPEQILERLTHYVSLISERLDTVAMPPETANMLRGIEAHLAQLADAFAHQQANALHQDRDLFRDLEHKLEDVVRRLENSASGSADTSLLDLIEDRFSDLARRIDDVREIEDERALHALESRLENMASKLYSVSGTGGDPRLLRSLETQLGRLSSQLSHSVQGTESIASLSPRLDHIERSITESRASLIEATRQAAEEALRKFAASREPEMVDGRLQEEIQKLESLTRQSAEKNSQTFEAIQETLLKIVSRLGTLETASDESLSAVPPDTLVSGDGLGIGTSMGRGYAPLAPSGSAYGSDTSRTENTRFSAPSRLRSLSTAFGHRRTKQAQHTHFASHTPEPRLTRSTDGDAPERENAPDIHAILRRVTGERRDVAPPLTSRADEPHSTSGKSGIGRILARHRKKTLVAIGSVILLAGGIQIASTIADQPSEERVAAHSTSTDETATATMEPRDPIHTSAISADVEQKPLAEDRIVPTPIVALAEQSSDASAKPVEVIRFIPQASDLPADLEPEVLRNAALEGNAVAFFEIANRLVEGRGVAVDLEAAATWYERAAEQGLALAQYRIGNMYEKGTGVKRDIASAKKWYQTAAEQGNVNAMHNLGVLMAMGVEDRVDNKEAVRWFTEASDFDVTDSQFNLAILAAKGLGMPKDLTEAYKWFDIVARKGDTDAAAKRDEVASAMSPEELKVAEGKAMLWQARAVNPAANTVTVPVEWSGDVPLASDSVEFKRAVANIQLILNKMGFDAGAADGIVGEKTREAIRAFQSENGMSATGEIDNELVKKLLERNETA